ncbi:MAG: hypothetical protein AMXMBFR57_22620 [Acidimicrobiia bacterium]
MILLHKILPVFVLPLGLALILLLVGFWRRSWRWPVAAVVLLLMASNPVVGTWFGRAVEAGAVRLTPSQVQPADAIIVLSAGRVRPPGAAVSEWQDANRFFGGLELFRAGKATHLIFTGAPVSGGQDLPTEGDVLAGLAREMGVPADAISVTGHVVNTAEEARKVRGVLEGLGSKAPRVLLVTSAFHLPRARSLFEGQGMVVEGFPVDFMAPASRGFSPLDLFPSLTALSQTETAMREWYGRGFYWILDRLSVAEPASAQ